MKEPKENLILDVEAVMDKSEGWETERSDQQKNSFWRLTSMIVHTRIFG